MGDIFTIDGIGALAGYWRTCKKSHRKYRGGRFVGCRKGGWIRWKKHPKTQTSSKRRVPTRRGKGRTRSYRKVSTRRFNPLKICTYGAPIAGGKRRGLCPTKAEAMARARRIFRKATGFKAPKGASVAQMAAIMSQFERSPQAAAQTIHRAELVRSAPRSAILLPAHSATAQAYQAERAAQEYRAAVAAQARMQRAARERAAAEAAMARMRRVGARAPQLLLPG